MSKRAATIALATLALALGGCAVSAVERGGTDVTRYHLGEPIAAGSVVVEPLAAPGATVSPEYRTYADAVAAELASIGFAPVAAGGSSQYVAAVSFLRASRGVVRTPPKFSIGLGGGGYSGGGVGLGGGVSTGIGGGLRDVIVSELAVQLRRRSDGTIVWEGRAQRQGLAGRTDDQPGLTAARLAKALFRGFPGESGITISVP